MAVRFKPNEGWSFDTTEEAAAFYRQISNSNGAVITPIQRKSVVGHSTNHESAALTDSARKLILALVDRPDGMSGHSLAQVVGVEPKGVGSVMGTISRWGESYNLTRKEMIVKKRTRDATTGKTIRILRLTNAFRKKVQAGGFSELK